MKILSLSAAALLAIVTPMFADDTTDITPLRVKDLPETTFFCVKKKLTLPEVGAFAAAEIDPLVEAAREAHLDVRGPVTFFYTGIDGDPKTVFTLEIGVPVMKQADAKAPYYFEKKPKFKCVATLYQGGVKGIGPAWMQFVSKLAAAGHAPTDQCREAYYYWETPDSPNNVVEFEQGIR